MRRGVLHTATAAIGEELDLLSEIKIAFRDKEAKLWQLPGKETTWPDHIAEEHGTLYYGEQNTSLPIR